MPAKILGPSEGSADYWSVTYKCSGDVPAPGCLPQGLVPVEHLQSKFLAPEKMAHSACLSVDLNTHLNKQYAGHFVDHACMSLRSLHACLASCHRSFIFPPGERQVCLPEDGYITLL